MPEKCKTHDKYLSPLLITAQLFCGFYDSYVGIESMGKYIDKIIRWTAIKYQIYIPSAGEIL